MLHASVNAFVYVRARARVRRERERDGGRFHTITHAFWQFHSQGVPKLVTVVVGHMVLARLWIKLVNDTIVPLLLIGPINLDSSKENFRPVREVGISFLLNLLLLHRLNFASLIKFFQLHCQIGLQSTTGLKSTSGLVSGPD